MWIEFEIMLKEKSINWNELGFENKFEFTRRLIGVHEIYFLQELLEDIQILVLHDQSSFYIRGNYEMIRDEIMKLSQENE